MCHVASFLNVIIYLFNHSKYFTWKISLEDLILFFQKKKNLVLTKKRNVRKSAILEEQNKAFFETTLVCLLRSL